MIRRGDIRWFRFATPDQRRPVKPEWIRSVERSWLGPWISSFPEQRWNEVRGALLTVLGLIP